MAIVQHQLDRLAKTAQNKGLSALLIAPSEDLVCVLGHAPMICERFQGLFILPSGDYFYICNLLYEDEMAERMDRDRVYPWFDGDGFLPTVKKVFTEKGLIGGKIGVSRAVRAFNTLAIAADMDVAFVDAMTLIHEARIIKSEEELNGLRKAAQIADEAFVKTLPDIKPGMTEAELKTILTGNMIALGGKGPGGLIASGPNGALPHYMGTGRVLQKGDAIVMDFGCFYDNMKSDTTRTVFLGEPTEKQKAVYALVLEANLAGEKAAFDGAFIPDIDKAARDVIDAAGYGKYFTTRLGHGIGYLGHEAPDIKKINEQNLEKGMAFSIEPGIYLTDEFGVRIEDIVCINLKGETEILNQSSKELTVIPC